MGCQHRGFRRATNLHQNKQHAALGRLNAAPSKRWQRRSRPPWARASPCRRWIWPNLPQRATAVVRPLSCPRACVLWTWRRPRPTRHAQRSERALQRVIDGLNGRHPLIRIGFAAAPGYGHQSASLLVARRLRALGYRGALDLVCNIAARQKLAHLLPGVSPHASSVQSFAAAQVRVLPHDVAKLRLGVGLFGGLDCPGQRSTWLDVDRCLVLQPLQWPERCCMLDRGMMRTLALPQRLGYHEALTQPPSLTGLLEHNLTGAKHLPGLLEIVRRVQSGRLDLMTVYGLHRAPPEAARHLLAGLQLAQSERAAAKPTLALLITPDPVNLDGVPRCSAAEVRRIADFARLASPQGLLACSVGNLPEPVFRALLRLSTWAAGGGGRQRHQLPALGAGALSLCERLDHPAAGAARQRPRRLPGARRQRRHQPSAFAARGCRLHCRPAERRARPPLGGARLLCGPGRRPLAGAG